MNYDISLRALIFHPSNSTSQNEELPNHSKYIQEVEVSVLYIHQTSTSLIIHPQLGLPTTTLLVATEDSPLDLTHTCH